MTNTHDIVIPRSELPEVVVTDCGSGTSFRLKEASSVDATARQKALEHLALAEAIDQHYAALAVQKDEKKLDEEGPILHNALHSQNAAEWEANSYAKKYWRNVARAARELHGK